MATSDVRTPIGFTGLDLTTTMDAATRGSLSFVIKDHPNNIDRHAILLGRLVKSTIVLAIENDKLVITVKEKTDGNGSEPG